MSQEGLTEGAAAPGNLAVCGLRRPVSSFREHSGSIRTAVPPGAAFAARDSWRSGGYIRSARAKRGWGALAFSPMHRGKRSGFWRLGCQVSWPWEWSVHHRFSLGLLCHGWQVLSKERPWRVVVKSCRSENADTASLHAV